MTDPIGHSALTDLAAGLEDTRLYTRPTPEYYEALKPRSDNEPEPVALIARPASAQDVAKVLAWCRKHQCEVVVREDGRPASKTPSAPRLMIDLRRMNSISVDAQRRVVRVQTGASWARLDQELFLSGLAIPSRPRNLTAPSTTTSGRGSLAGLQCLPLDNILSATVVVASGDILTANETENTDLFWAIKGAAQHFGIITDVAVRAHQQGEVFGGCIVFADEQLEDVVAAANLIHSIEDERAALNVLFMRRPGTAGLVVRVLISYNGAEHLARSHFQRLLEIPSPDAHVAMMPYPNLTALQDEIHKTGGRQLHTYSGFLPPLDVAFARHVFDDFEASSVKKHAPSSSIRLDFSGCPRTHESRDGRATALPREMSLVRSVAFAFSWTNPANDELVAHWSRQLQAAFTQQIQNAARQSDPTEAQARLPPGSVSSMEELTAAEVYGENLPRLQRIKAVYDPDVVFSGAVSIEPFSEWSRPMPRS